VIIELNIDQIIGDAEAFGSPYDAATEEELNLMTFHGTRVLNQLRAVKYAIDAMEATDADRRYANKAVRVFACIRQIENMLDVVVDARQDMKHV
jgi:hypothetical protein